ncbi:MAG: S-methyl-5'-thioadenosine phosphorylase [Chloroflexota bacterium]
MSEIELAFIGGSGVYGMSELTDVESVSVTTPFGMPSDDIVIGTLHGRRVAFLPRHGRGHVLTPTEVPYRANMYALKLLGVRYVISISACGSLRESIAPGDIVIPDQLIDFTKGLRDRSFFGDGLVAHVSVAQPFSPELSRALADAVSAAGATPHEGGSFITVEGPRFSTRGESELFRTWDMDIIGMTTSPEAFLAAEAEMAYACLAHVTDYDVWHESEEPVTVEMVIRTLSHNRDVAHQTISALVQSMDQWEGDFPAHHALENALITDPAYIPEQAKVDREAISGRYLD